MKKKILVIGDIFLDIYSYGNIDRISPENHVQIFNLKSNDYMPGGAANVALNLNKLGTDVTLIGKIANDNAGIKIKKYLDKNKIKFMKLI